MRKTVPIALILRRLAAMTVGGACVAGASAACGGGTALTTVSDGGADSATSPIDGSAEGPLCGKDLFDAAVAAPDFDYLGYVVHTEVWQLDGGVPDPDGGQTKYPCAVVRSAQRERGTACASAKDPAACRAKLEERPVQTPELCSGSGPDPRVGQARSHVELVATRGDDVIRITDLGRAFAPITTPEEAAFVTPEIHGFGSVACDSRPSCGGEAVRSVKSEPSGAGGFTVTIERAINTMCQDEGRKRIVYTVSADGTVVAGEPEELAPAGSGCGACGRVFEGEGELTAAATPAARLVRAAYYEAGSVTSFRRLARELRAHGAPAALIRAARRAARDEIRHARATDALARTFGARDVARPSARPLPVRPLFEVAMENAVEGCVNEAFAAALGLVQAKRAAREDVRAVMATIADDEVSHAKLAWAVAAWAEGALDAGQRAEIEAARRAALHRLVANDGADGADDEPSQRALGLPSRAEARRMARDLADALLAA